MSEQSKPDFSCADASELDQQNWCRGRDRFPTVSIQPSISNPNAWQTKVDFDAVECCFPEGGIAATDGSVTVSAQWLHDFAHNVLAKADYFHGIESMRQDRTILEKSLRLMSTALDELVDACQTSDGTPAVPRRDALMRAKRMLPPYCKNALGKKS